ncbi:MAG: hypothetical protein J6T15_06195 [Bacilli bacterium]|nr:hypothetical protein [Bacilli bacterium]
MELETSKRIYNFCVPTKKESIYMAIISFCFLMIFICGSFNVNTTVEQIAYDIALEVEKENNVAIMCKSENSSIISGESFSKYVNDQFYDTNPFKSVIGYNLDKSVSCSIENLGEHGTNLSFLASSYFSNHIDSDGNIIFDRYYLKLLFKETNTYRGNDVSNFLYITKTQADYLIRTDLDCNSYEDVINKRITLTVKDSASTVWKIANIIDDESLFCTLSKKYLNNYVVCFTLVPESLKKTESMLAVMSSSRYSNINFISLLKDNFPSNEYTFSSINNDSSKSIVSLKDYLNDTEGKGYLNVLSVLAIMFFSMPFIFLGYVCLVKKIKFKNILQFVFSSITIWLIFYIIYHIFDSVLFFSFTSLSVFLVLFLCLLLYMVVVWLIKNYGKQDQSI